ncbi:MAG: radical SAM protein [Clostridiaceae bacterium]|jgi:wyosine [tRNA(Phe)-imidazoG37] synthetase (radical SAM superfamily)|nr:radical SAM protein [Clostridiaceae bacterium]
MIVYGPVPSRRLGQSIGINNIPPKICSYSCVYCQLGRTNQMQVKRQAFYSPEDICREAEIKLKQLETENKQADYFSFVPDGEPTLDINLGKTIELLKPYNTKIAVITNASLLWMDEVKQDLMDADWVSLSIDAADEDTWHKIDRPHGMLKHQNILKGIVEFSKSFRGTLVTETMLVEGINDQEACIEKIAEQVALVQPQKAYLLVPTRPPAEPDVKRASSDSLRNAAAIVRGVSGTDVECITGDEEEEGFFFTEDIADDIISIASVHPIREDIVESLLEKRNANRSVISELINQGSLIEYTYEGKKFYKRNIHK